MRELIDWFVFKNNGEAYGRGQEDQDEQYEEDSEAEAAFEDDINLSDDETSQANDEQDV
jgi:hypothetical protein